MMTASGRKNRLYALVGLLFLLVVGLLWHAGTLVQGSRKEVRKALPKAAGAPAPPAAVTKTPAGPASAETAAAGGAATVVRKKLPPLPPPVVAVAPAAPVSTETATEKVPEASVALSPAPVPTAAAVPPPAAPEPPVSVPQAPAPHARAEQAPLPFSILLSSCREKENALAQLPRFRRAGSIPHVVRSEVKGKGSWWRVMAGAYRTAEEAARAQQAIGLPDAAVVRTPFANLLGAFPSEAAAAETAARATAKGYFPYALPGAGGSIRLLVGGFLTEAEAENLLRELKARGIASEVIRR
ncbi:MAG: SPOR domain-containing protein [Desulfobacterales bacterium]